MRQLKDYMKKFMNERGAAEVALLELQSMQQDAYNQYGSQPSDYTGRSGAQRHLEIVGKLSHWLQNNKTSIENYEQRRSLEKLIAELRLL